MTRSNTPERALLRGCEEMVRPIAHQELAGALLVLAELSRPWRILAGQFLLMTGPLWPHAHRDALDQWMGLLEDEDKMASVEAVLERRTTETGS